MLTLSVHARPGHLVEMPGCVGTWSCVIEKGGTLINIGVHPEIGGHELGAQRDDFPFSELCCQKSVNQGHKERP